VRKTLSKLYSKIYPKPDGSEYNSKELIGRAIVFGSLIALLIFASVRAYLLISEQMNMNRKPFKFTQLKHTP